MAFLLSKERRIKNHLCGEGIRGKRSWLLGLLAGKKKMPFVPSQRKGFSERQVWISAHGRAA